MTTLAPDVSLNSVKRYLTSLGWGRKSLPSGTEVFTTSDNDIEIVLPATSAARDLKQRLSNALATLAALERRAVSEIVAAISSIGYDLVRSRLPINSVRSDTIRLHTAEEFIRRMSRLLAASAHAEFHMGPYFERIDANAQKYADDCRFAHTFAGSFGFVVESPVGPHTIVPGFDTPPPPVERRIIERLARGLTIVEEATKQQEPEKFVGNYKVGLNANACDELAALIEVPQVNVIAFEIVFSSEWQVPTDIAPIAVSQIGGPAAAEVLKAGAKALRYVDYEKRTAIAGLVRTLHSMENPSDLFSISGLQDVVVEWITEKFGRRNVRVSLGPEEYLQAVDAHRTGRQIYVYGELEQGRPWRLMNARDFRLL